MNLANLPAQYRAEFRWLCHSGDPVAMSKFVESHPELMVFDGEPVPEALRWWRPLADRVPDDDQA